MSAFLIFLPQWARRSISRVLLPERGISSHIINSSASMDRPFLLEVQCLQERMREGTVLCPNDVDILDRSFAAPSSSEIANAHNTIFSLLATHHINLFFESFSAIQAYARHNYTLLYAQNVLTRRIKGEWRSFDPRLQASLREFVINGMQNCLLEGDPQGLLLSYNQALVEVLRLEWQGLLGEFVENLEAQGLNTVPAKVLNNLTILKMLLSEGFGGSEGFVSSAESQHFKDTLERDMRSILKYLCLCLHDEGPERFHRITRCLETLCHSVDYIPAFELFNCNLIELLVGLIGAQEFKGKLTLCFEEIFRFEDRGTTGSSHSKIAKKLLLILEHYLERFERQQGDYHSQQKQCDSTEDSLHSRKTRRRRVEPIDMHTDLINLIYEFLVRYVPAMDKSKNEGDLDIEFEGSIKLYFSHDLYEAFRMIYWRLAAFLGSAMEKFNPFMEELSDELLEQSRKVVVCLRHLIAMQGKLKLPAKDELHANLMQSAIFNFATLPLEFHPYYLHFGLLQNGCEKAEEPLPFSADLQEDYKDLIRQILKLKDVSFIFFDVIEQRVSEVITAYYRKRKEGDPPEVPLIQLINTVNRACWSAVYAFNIDHQATITHNFTQMQREIIKAANYETSKKATERSVRSQELAKCFLVNGKYVTQVYMNHLTVHEGLLISFQNDHFNDTFLEYSFIVFSKILHYKTLDPHFEIEDIYIIIERLHKLEGVNPLNQNLIPLYPAMVRLAVVICELVIKSKLDERKFPLRDLLEKLIGFQLQALQDFSITNATNDQQQLQRTILLFRKLISISTFLRTTITVSQNINTLSSFFIWARQTLFNAVTQFQFKSTCFSQFLMLIEREHFDIAHILTFRQYYLDLLREHVAISTVILSLQTTNHKKSKDMQKVSKIMIAENAMRKDFIGQKRFKTKEYMSFALEVYRLLVAIGFKDHMEIINNSILTAMISLDGWEEDAELIQEKYRFWGELTKTHLLRLGKKNRELMVHLLQEFQLSQVSQQEIIMKAFQNLTDTLSEACLRHEHPLLEEFFEIFLATFQKLFSQPCKKEPVFNEMAMLMLRYVELAASMPPFEPRSRKDNLDVLYILLQEHIQQSTRLQFTQEDCLRLQRLFQIRDSGRWRVELKDYVIYLRQLNRAQTSMTN